VDNFGEVGVQQQVLKLGILVKSFLDAI